VKLLLTFTFAGLLLAQPKYDLLLQNGHVVDSKNRISAVRDVAIKDGKIVAVAAKLDAKDKKLAQMIDSAARDAGAEDRQRGRKIGQLEDVITGQQNVTQRL
jgi:dihydroorotase